MTVLRTPEGDAGIIRRREGAWKRKSLADVDFDHGRSKNVISSMFWLVVRRRPSVESAEILSTSESVIGWMEPGLGLGSVGLCEFLFSLANAPSLAAADEPPGSATCELLALNAQDDWSISQAVVKKGL